MPGSAALPPVVAMLTANITGFKAGMGEAKKELAGFADANKSTLGAASNIGGLLLKGIAVGAVAVGGASLKMAGDFQESVTQLQTGAGESASNLGLVSKGMLDMASKVGQSAASLSSGMYLVESAGYHGADGLSVLKAAAEGAKLGNADLKTVADGVTTALTDYQAPASDAAKITSQLVTAVSLGKTTMGDLAGSLSTVLPQASKAGLGLDQVLGSMSTMTAQGISAQQAAQNLASTISSLQNPTSVQSKAMAQMGLNSIDVAQQLGKKGLTGTMGDLAQAIMGHMGPAGLVLQSSFNQSKLAADSAKKMLSQLPPDLQKMAQGYLDGTVTQKQWMAELKTQPALVSNLGRQFATTAKQANGFSDQLKSGKGDAATFNALMADMTGGQSGLNTALALTGNNLGTFQSNVTAVSGASADAKGNVKDWGEVQKDFNFKLDQAKSGAESLGIKLGMALIPKVETVMADVQATVGWFTKHKTASEVLGVALGALAVGFVGINVAMSIGNTVRGISAVLTGEQTAATVLQVAALGAQKVAILASTAAHYAVAAAAGVVTAAQWAWNAAMDANPIGLVIVAIGALVAGIVWIATKTTWFQDLWKAIWPGIHAAFNAAVKGIKDGAEAVWDFLKTVFSWTPLGLVVDNWGKITGFFKNVPHLLGDALKDVASFITAPFRLAFDGVANLWNQSLGSLNITVPSWVPGIGGKGFTFPKLPMLAAGTDNWPGGPAIVNDGGPELLNLPRGTEVTPAGKTRDLLNGAASKGNGGLVVNIETFNAAGQSPQQIAAALEFRMRTVSY